MSDDGFRFFQAMLVSFDAPSFLRRASAVDEAWSNLQGRCRRKRLEQLELPRMRLGKLFALLKSWPQIPATLCPSDDFAYLEKLHRNWLPRLRSVVTPAKSELAIRRALSDLQLSFERLNRRWSDYVGAINLNQINQLRDEYNRFYVLEKECAVWSTQVAQQGFSPLPPIRHDTLLEEFPLLKVPGSKNGKANSDVTSQ